MTHTGIDLGDGQWERSAAVELAERWDSNAQRWTLELVEQEQAESDEPNSSPAPVSGIDSGPKHIISNWRDDIASDLYLNRTASPGEAISLWNLNDSWASQRWHFEPAGNGSYRIRNEWGANSGYLTRGTDQGAAGATVWLHSREENWESQLWELIPGDYEIGRAHV